MPRILCVEDDQTMRELLREHLQDAYEVIETSDASEAIALALQHKPDCILLDLMRPESSGFELCQILSSLNVTRSEEHTSELQSPCNLVCRLLLEKKKKILRDPTEYSRETRAAQRRRTAIHPPSPARHDALGGRRAARQTRYRAGQRTHGPHPLLP